MLASQKQEGRAKKIWQGYSKSGGGRGSPHPNNSRVKSFCIILYLIIKLPFQISAPWTLVHYYPGGGGGWGRKKPDIMQNSVQLNLPTGTGTELGNILQKYESIMKLFGMMIIIFLNSRKTNELQKRKFFQSISKFCRTQFQFQLTS